MGKICDILKKFNKKSLDKHLPTNYSQTYIMQNDKIVGIISGTFNCTIYKDSNAQKKTFEGQGDELFVPIGNEEIYGEWGERSIFDVVIKRKDLVIKLCDATLLPRPNELYYVDKVVVVKNFKFVSL